MNMQHGICINGIIDITGHHIAHYTRRYIMGIVRGLTALNKQLDKPQMSSDGQKGRWLQLKDGESLKIKFLQELDPDSPNYNDKMGAGFIAVEHTNPKDYRRKGLCSADDQGRCFGCEMHRRDPKEGWKGRSRLYANVLVMEEKEEPYVAIFSQGSGPKSATPAVIQYAGETGSITNVTWKLKRTGEKTETNYSIIPLPANANDPDITKFEMFDLEKVAVRDVPYADQENFYLGISSNSSAESSASSSVEW